MSTDTGASVASLPDAAVQAIFGYVPYENRARLALVCKQWYQVLSGPSSLWSQLPSQQVLLCNNASRRPQFLAWLQPKAAAVRACRTSTCTFPLNVATELLDMIAPHIQQLGATYAHWGNLQALASCSRLTTLSISLEWGHLHSLFPDEEFTWPQLTHLELHIRRANLDSIALPRSLLLLQQLHTLVLGSASPTTLLRCVLPATGGSTTVRVWPRLRRLWMQHAVPLFHQSVRLLEVRELCLSSRAVPVELPIGWLNQHCPALTSLTLSRVDLAAYNGDQFWTMLANQKLLQHLALQYLRNLPEDFCCLPAQRHQLLAVVSASMRGLELAQVPPVLSTASQLRFLDISHNRLQQLPFHREVWPHLQWLDVTCNVNIGATKDAGHGTPRALVSHLGPVGPGHARAVNSLTADSEEGGYGQIVAYSSAAIGHTADAQPTTALARAADGTRRGLLGVRLSWLSRQQLEETASAHAESVASPAAEACDQALRQHLLLTQLISMSVPMLGLVFEHGAKGGRQGAGGVLWLLKYPGSTCDCVATPSHSSVLGPSGTSVGLEWSCTADHMPPAPAQTAAMHAVDQQGHEHRSVDCPTAAAVPGMQRAVLQREQDTHDAVMYALQQGYVLAPVLRSRRPALEMAAAFGAGLLTQLPGLGSQLPSDGRYNASTLVKGPTNPCSGGPAGTRIVGDQAWSMHCAVARRLRAPHSFVLQDSNSRDVSPVWYQAFGPCDCTDPWTCRCNRHR